MMVLEKEVNDDGEKAGEEEREVEQLQIVMMEKKSVEVEQVMIGDESELMKEKKWK